MENRERDQMRRNEQSTSVGDVNRKTSSQIGKDKSDSSAEFGQNIGRSENLNEPNSRGSKSGSGGYDSSRSSDSSRDYDSSSGDRSRGSSMGEPRNSDSGSAIGKRH
ncbi:MAG: hypothetical protein QOK37_1088 [Thermoanaerobaculia bacterium]|jgi:hypothetical protein|nr:hypothetical protein [Thermoanaerobaculia bacterium]